MNEEEYTYDPELVEALAEYAHESWSGWMAYLFRFGTQHKDGSFTIPADKVARWQRQLVTAYTDLAEVEKESDRSEARQIIDLVNAYYEQLEGDEEAEIANEGVLVYDATAPDGLFRPSTV